jgi:hypothetical protein
LEPLSRNAEDGGKSAQRGRSLVARSDQAVVSGVSAEPGEAIVGLELGADAEPAIAGPAGGFRIAARRESAIISSHCSQQ